jgi:hypothetical protein
MKNKSTPEEDLYPQKQNGMCVIECLYLEEFFLGTVRGRDGLIMAKKFLFIELEIWQRKL